jgi:hypothetical protein
VIACAVPRQVAAEITEVMNSAGHHAEFVDRCSTLSVADHLLLRDIEQVPQQKTEDLIRSEWETAVATRLSAPRRASQLNAKVA